MTNFDIPDLTLEQRAKLDTINEALSKRSQLKNLLNILVVAPILVSASKDMKQGTKRRVLKSTGIGIGLINL